MKILYFTIVSLLCGLSLGGCSDSKESLELPGTTYQPTFSGSIEGYGNNWQGTDTERPDSLHIYAVKDGNVIVSEQIYSPLNSSGQSSLISEAQPPMELDKDTKYVFYSYCISETESPLSAAEAVSVTLQDVQYQQTGGNRTDNRKYNFMYAKSESDIEEIEFRYKHEFALIEFELPAGVKAIILNATDPDEEYAGTRTFSMQDEEWNSSIAGRPYINLQLNNPIEKTGDNAWMSIFPGHSGKPFELIVQTADDRIYRLQKKAPEEGYRAGQKYTVNINLEDAVKVLEPPAQINNVWQIGNTQDLEWFRDHVNCGAATSDAILLSNIDLNGNEQNQWFPIAVLTPYAGHFNGNGYHISGLYINKIRNAAGLYAYIDPDACIENLKVSGEIIAERINYVGGIAAEADGATISQCQSEINMDIKHAAYVGGIVGNSRATVSDCIYSGTIRITGYEAFAGGIASTNYGTIENCYSTGSFIFSCACGGGICGGNGGVTRNCATLFRDFNASGDIMTVIKGRITGFNIGESYHNIAYEGIHIGTSISNNAALQGIDKSWEECLSPATYVNELMWSEQIWGFTENNLPYLKVIRELNENKE